MIFLDKTGRRWAVCRNLIRIAVAVAILTTFAWTASLFVTPYFKPLTIDSERLYRQNEQREQIGAPGTLVKTSFALSDQSSADGSVHRNVEQPQPTERATCEMSR